jgi:hypothetical protein
LIQSVGLNEAAWDNYFMMKRKRKSGTISLPLNKPFLASPRVDRSLDNGSVEWGVRTMGSEVELYQTSTLSDCIGAAHPFTQNLGNEVLPERSRCRYAQRKSVPTQFTYIIFPGLTRRTRHFCSRCRRDLGRDSRGTSDLGLPRSDSEIKKHLNLNPAK